MGHQARSVSSQSPECSILVSCTLCICALPLTFCICITGDVLFFKWLSFHSKEIKDCATCWTDLQLKQCFSILSKRDDDTSNSNCLQGDVIFMPAWSWRHFCLEMFSCFPPNTPSRPWATSLLEVKSTHGYSSLHLVVQRMKELIERENTCSVQWYGRFWSTTNFGGSFNKDSGHFWPKMP